MSETSQGPSQAPKCLSDEEIHTSRLERRSFLIKLGAGSALIAGAALSSACSPNDPCDNDDVTTGDVPLQDACDSDRGRL